MAQQPKAWNMGKKPSGQTSDHCLVATADDDDYDESKWTAHPSINHRLGLDNGLSYSLLLPFSSD